jgi:DNA-binding transcriptional MerR regulator
METLTRLRPVEVARHFHRTASWLTKLERAGIIPPAPRDWSGRRFYEPEHVEQIRSALERHRGVVLTGPDAA